MKHAPSNIPQEQHSQFQPAGQDDRPQGSSKPDQRQAQSDGDERGSDEPGATPSHTPGRHNVGR